MDDLNVVDFKTFGNCTARVFDERSGEYVDCEKYAVARAETENGEYYLCSQHFEFVRNAAGGEK